MRPNACFRVSVDDVAADFRRYIELARTRAFEIFADGKVEVLLVPISAVPEWHEQLQIAVPTALMTDDERAAMSSPIGAWPGTIPEGDEWPEGS
ncbi:hypothetical protein [Novosphingobium aerophilum]|uniref:Prevent-host-death protein n=1 Tax=Novosphingobium aerophilum TaxID=2839843 RepID=A0A7X1KDU8_9SPHN|nr:hypothetical protein [Novosphingobium aerophilum]MBC2653735.1 hypothetical protein [Novosphingobium aerophilum]